MPRETIPDQVSQQQLGLLPPERVHVRIDVYLVAGADVIPSLLSIMEGANDTQVSLRTSHAVRGDQEHDELLSQCSTVLREALNLVGPF